MPPGLDLLPAARDLDLALQHMSDGIYLVDAEGRIVCTNRRLYELLDLPPDAVGIGDRVEKLLKRIASHGGFTNEAEYRRVIALAREAPQRPFTFERVRPNGTVLEVSGNPTSAGGFVVMLRDVTAARRAGAALAEAGAVRNLLSTAIESISDAFAVFDAGGHLVLANWKYRTLDPDSVHVVVPGVTFEAIVRAGLSRGCYPEAIGREEEFVAERLRAFDAGGRAMRFRLSTGRWIEGREYPLPDGGRLSIREDITERVEQAEHLRQSEARLRSLADNLQGVLFRRRLEPDGSVHHPYVSARVRDMLGVDPQDIMRGDVRLADFVHPEDRPLAEQILSQARRQTEPVVHELRMIRADDGSVRWWRTHATPQTGEEGAVHWDGIALDVTDQKAAEERLHHMARHDPLTDLPNRASFAAFIDHLVPMARRTGAHFAVVALNIRRFAEVNRALGIDGGDEVLRRVGRLIVDSLRPGDMVARLAGDVFLVLLTGLKSREDVRRPLDKLSERLAEGIAVPDRQISLRAAMGVSMFPDDGDNSEMLLEAADVTLKRVRREGDGDYRLHAPGMTEHARRLADLERELTHAIHSDGLVLHYQPKVCMRTGSVPGVEALVRWMHPTRGMVSPADFIPVAEDTGLIGPLGEWVLQRACRDAGRWRRNGHPDLTVSVNLSARQLARGDLAERILEILAETGLEPAALELELTESALISDAAAVGRILAVLGERGVRFALDDFGTGYSSLAYLARFPIHVLKIDRSFVADMPEDQAQASIVSMICGMARSLDMRTVAEGVETREQLLFLRAYQCDAVQGYLFSRPLPADALEAFLAQNRAAAAVPPSATGRKRAVPTSHLLR